MKKTTKNNSNQLELDFSLENHMTTFTENRSLPFSSLSGIDRISDVKVFNINEKLREAEKLREREIINYIISNSKRF